MKREIHFFGDHGCYVVRWLAALTREAAIEHWRDLVEDPRFEAGLAALHDARGCPIDPSWNKSLDEALHYRVEIEPQVGFGRTAILSDLDETHEAARRLIRLLELNDALVTRDEAQARRWVGLPADVVLPYRA